PQYMAEGGQVTLKGYGFTSLESENKITVNGIPATFRIRAEEVIIDVPEGTFGDDRFVAEVAFENVYGNADTASFFYDKYPRVYEFTPKRVFAGETISLEGDYFDTNTTNTEVLFMPTKEGYALQRGEIVYLDNYTI